jgi:predicted TIM-barrel fold metal-dependent hydrolase
MPRIRIFDANAMFGVTLAAQPAPIPDAPALLREMDYFGLDEALVWRYSFGFAGRAPLNRGTLESTRGQARLTPCWVLHTGPAVRGEKIEDQVEQLRAAGMRAARVLAEEGPTASPMALSAYEVAPLFDALARRRVPVLLPAEHLALPPGAYAYGFERIDALCREHPELPVVLLEPRYQGQSQLVALMRRHANLHATISGLALFRQLESFVAVCGAKRFLYSSNLPVGNPAQPLAALLYSGLSETDKRLIGAENLKRLLAEVR